MSGCGKVIKITRALKFRIKMKKHLAQSRTDFGQFLVLFDDILFLSFFCGLIFVLFPIFLISILSILPLYPLLKFSEKTGRERSYIRVIRGDKDLIRK